METVGRIIAGLLLAVLAFIDFRAAATGRGGIPWKGGTPSSRTTNLGGGLIALSMLVFVVAPGLPPAVRPRSARGCWCRSGSAFS